MNKNKKTLQFWFEFASTYSYLSVFRIESLAQKQNILIEWKPFLLGPIFKEQNWHDSPFKIYQNKGDYMWQDMKRLCQKYDLPWQKPASFPQNSLLACRIALALQDHPKLSQFVKKVFAANFSYNQNIADTNLLKTFLDDLQINSDKTLEQAQSDFNKNALKERTQHAKDLKIFGAPTFITPDGELFWGNDRLQDAIDWIK